MFNAPIPGQSLTDEPGNYPWERPPKYEDVDEIVDFYMSKLNTSDAIDDILDLVEQQIPIDAITGALLTNNVANGYHSIDTAILVGPVIHEFIRTAATKAGIEYVDNYDATRNREKRKKEKLKLKTKMKLEEIKRDNAKQSTGTMRLAEAKMQEESMDAEQVEQPMAQEMQPTAPAPRGLMSRGM